MANYQAFSASVQGATHVKKNIVMQDASGKFERKSKINCSIRWPW